jgi:hypothetical protein
MGNAGGSEATGTGRLPFLVGRSISKLPERRWLRFDAFFKNFSLDVLR